MENMHNKIRKLTSIDKFYRNTFNSSIHSNGFGIIAQTLPNDNIEEFIESMKTGKIDNLQTVLLKASIAECELTQAIV